MTTASAEQPTLLLDDGYVGMHVLLDGCTVCGSRGYSLFRASQSIAHGRWYVEVTWLLADDSPAPHHNSSGHLSGQYDPAVRVGWCTAEAPVDAPVGFDTSGFAYASRTGHAFHRAQGKPYGRPFCQYARSLFCSLYTHSWPHLIAHTLFVHDRCVQCPAT